MVIHHIVTVLLVTGSFLTGHFRVGAVFMLTFDPADVPLHVAKQCKYLGWQTLADVNFVVFMVVFFVTRVIFYPYLVWSAHFETVEYFVQEWKIWICFGFADILLLLNFYWFWLILRVLFKLISGSGVEDVRSDDEDDEDGDSEQEKKKKASSKKVA
jgi:hypothetical protein